MAGAGYKLFNTGDVLTAAQVNTYLMEQTVMVFDDATARTTALTGVVSEGMISYLKDTNAVEVYDGSNWVASDDPNAIQNSIVDAKGDLISATADNTPARLAVGNPGETLVANDSASTGLSWQGNFAAGKNKIINGDFAINQRNFTSTTVTGYGFDRFNNLILGGTGTATFSAQTFTPGTAPVAGYEGSNYLRIVTTGQTATNTITRLEQFIENVRTFAGQTITISFWAKAASGTPSVSVELAQTYGTGGSPSAANNIIGGNVTLSTSWNRYSVTVAVPSLSGKTIGTDANTSSLSLRLWVSAGSDFNARTGSLGIQSNTFEFWGIQAEAGNVATAFQTATGTLAGELQAAQRYYFRFGGQSPYNTYGMGIATSSTNLSVNIQHPVPLRVNATSVDFANLGVYNSGSVLSATNAVLDRGGTFITSLNITSSGMTTNNTYALLANNSTSSYFGLSAEL